MIQITRLKFSFRQEPTRRIPFYGQQTPVFAKLREKALRTEGFAVFGRGSACGSEAFLQLVLQQVPEQAGPFYELPEEGADALEQVRRGLQIVF